MYRENLILFQINRIRKVQLSYTQSNAVNGHRSNSSSHKRIKSTQHNTLTLTFDFHFRSSETHPISGKGPSLLPIDEFSLLSFAYILALMSLPDSTLSIAGSSSHPLIGPRPNCGDPYTQPISSSCMFRIELTNSRTVLNGTTPCRGSPGEDGGDSGK